MENPHRSQQIFRELMRAMASPGQVEPVEQSSLPLLDEICKTLLDHEVTLGAAGDGIDEKMIENILMLTGCRRAPVESADYVIVFAGCSREALLNVSVGTLEQPDRGATILYPVAGFNKPWGVNLTLSGPGINGRVQTTIDGVRPEELALVKKINSHFPLGLDLIFCDSSSLLAVPRSVAMTLKTEGG